MSVNLPALKGALAGILQIFLVVIVVLLWAYAKWRRAESRYKGLGDGSVQTIFEKKPDDSSAR